MNTSAIYTALVNIIYPIGTIIQNYDNLIDPGSYIPDTTWKRLEDVFLVNEGSIGNTRFIGGSIQNPTTGGEATVALTPDNLPTHVHEIGSYNKEKGGADPDTGVLDWATSEKHVQRVFSAAFPTQYTSLSKVGVYKTSDTGDNNYRHNNMPPYTRVYGWYRIS